MSNGLTEQQESLLSEWASMAPKKDTDIGQEQENVLRNWSEMSKIKDNPLPSKPQQAAERYGAEDDEFSVTDMAKNIPASAKQYGQDIMHPILYPVETIKAFRELGVDGVVGALGNLYKDRYGSIEQALKTVESDPVGFLADLSFILSGPAMLAQKTAAVGSTTAKAAGKVAKTAAAVDPVNLVKAGVKTVGKKVIPKNAPKTLYQKGAKFTPAGGVDVERAVNTALDEGIMPTYKGAQKAIEIQKAVGNEIGLWIDAKTATGATIDASELTKHVQAVRNKLGGMKSGSIENLRQVDDTLAEFQDLVQRNSVNGKLTPRQVQDYKLSLYDKIYPTPTGQAGKGTQAAEDALARGAKESLESIIDDIKDLNQRWGDIQNMKRPLISAAERIERRDILPLISAMNIGAGHSVGGNLGATLGVAATVLEMPRLKAKAALLMHNAQKANVFNNSIPLFYFTQGGLAKAGQIADEQKSSEYEDWANNYSGITLSISPEK